MTKKTENATVLDVSKAVEAKIAAVPGVSGVILRQFVDQEGKAVDTGAQSRLAELLARFKQSGIDDMKSATKEMYVDETDAKAKAKWRVRASEIRALYGAVRFGGFTPDGGFWKAVSVAPGILKEKMIRWTGDPVPTKTEKAQAAARKEVLMQTEAALRERDRILNTTGKPATDEQMQQAANHAQAQADQTWAVGMARALVKKYKADKCAYLVDALNDVIYGESAKAELTSAEKAA